MTDKWLQLPSVDETKHHIILYNSQRCRSAYSTLLLATTPAPPSTTVAKDVQRVIIIAWPVAKTLLAIYDHTDRVLPLYSTL